MTNDEQAIRERAYHLWQKEGSPDGRHEEFWERAVLMQAAEAKAPMTTPLQQSTPDEREIDEAMKETFPASDSPSYNAPKAAKAKKPGKSR